MLLGRLCPTRKDVPGPAGKVRLESSQCVPPKPGLQGPRSQKGLLATHLPSEKGCFGGQSPPGSTRVSFPCCQGAGAVGNRQRVPWTPVSTSDISFRSRLRSFCNNSAGQGRGRHLQRTCRYALANVTQLEFEALKGQKRWLYSSCAINQPTSYYSGHLDHHFAPR